MYIPAWLLIVIGFSLWFSRPGRPIGGVGHRTSWPSRVEWLRLAPWLIAIVASPVIIGYGLIALGHGLIALGY